MSDSTSSRSSRSEDNNIKKKVSYSTDYMPHLLQDSQKMLPFDQRILFQKYETKNENETLSEKKNNDNQSNASDKLSDYLTNDGENVANSISNKYSNTQLYNNNNNTNSFFSNINQSVPNQNKPEIIEEKKPENKNPEENGEVKENIFNDTYDEYNELSPDKQMLKRLDMLRKLGELVQYGVKLSQNYNMNSDYFAMKYEYELHKNIRAKQNSVNWMSSLMLNCIYGIEILNEKYNPFDLKLKNWSEQINADINNYYDVFGEIYEKYNQPGKNMAPELKLVLMISGSALKFHLNNTLLSQNNKIPPNLTQNTEQDPAILEQIRAKEAYEKIREETLKSSEILKEKTNKEHTEALKQMNDMLYLQNKKIELQKQEEERQKSFKEFEKMKMLLEQQNNAKMPNMNSISGMGVMPSPTSEGNMNEKYEEIRRRNINEHLQSIKEKVKNIDNKEDIENEPLYVRAANVKSRESNKNQLNKDDSTVSSKSSSKTSSEESSSRRKSEKSVSTTLSKRRYNKKGITIQTN